MKHIFRNKGIVLTSAMYVLALLSVISVTAITLSLSQTRQAIRQDKRTQAYYLAKTGAEAVSKYILYNPIDAEDIITAAKSNANSHFPNGTFEVEVLPAENPRQIIVRGLGYVGNEQNQVSVVMEQLNGAMLIDKAIYSNAPLDISGMIVNGDVQSGGVINYSVNGSNAFFGDAEENSPRVIKLAWPSQPMYYSPSSFEVKNQELDLDASYSFVKLEVQQNGILNIDAGNNVIRLFFDELVIDNIMNIDATEAGRVEIYINNSMTVTTKGIINNTTPDNLFIYLKEGSTFYMQANMILNGYIIGPDATVQIQSAQSTTNGAIIANIVQKNAQGQGPNGAVNFVELPSNFDISDVVREYRMLQWQN